MVVVDCTVGDGKTLEQFSKLIANRIKYLNESAKDSIAACAIDALISIRAATKIATEKVIKKEIEVKETGALYPSFKTDGKVKRFCLRYRGSNKEYKGTGKVVESEIRGNVQAYGVFVFNVGDGEKRRTFLIVSPNIQRAKEKAFQIKKSISLRYAGLAKTALTMLMKKTATINNKPDLVPQYVNTKANELTNKTESQNNGSDSSFYSLKLDDNLDYAVAAVKGGDSGVNLALQKSMNKVTATINRKCEKLLLFNKLETPFPEIRKR